LRELLTAVGGSTWVWECLVKTERSIKTGKFDCGDPVFDPLVSASFNLTSVNMKLSTFLPAVVGLAAAQTPAPYTDAKSGITFNTYINPSTGYFFGLALDANNTASTDFIATIGGKGTGWSGVSLGGGMLNKLLILAWPNGQSVVGSFRKTA
jgi:hypothetical protein